MLACAACGAPLAAQQESTTSEPSKTVFTSRDAWLAGAFTLGAVALTRVDSRVAHWFQDSVRQNDGTMRDLAESFTKVQETTLAIAGVLTYTVGRLSHSRTVADVGLHATEAIAFASIGSQIIRGPLGRSRPHVTNFDDPYDFHPFHGFAEFRYRAFPSIHSSSAFAAATVAVAETARRNPSANWWVAPLAYGIAAMPGYSRMYLGQHWASDIFMGAFMGTLSGLKVVNYSHDHPDNKIDRFFLGATQGLRVSGNSAGMAISYSVKF
jgi:membrane-associated phospholipid phosphatase